jgi:hypothetical protein
MWMSWSPPLVFALAAVFSFAGCGFKPTSAPDLGDDPSFRGVAGQGATTAANVDLTVEGTRNWVHWGYLAAAGTDRKAAAVSLTDYATISGGPVDDYDNNTVLFRWSDGAPDADVGGTSTGIFIRGADDGFRLAVPAGDVAQTLVVFVGGYKSRGALHAEVSDAPSLAYDDASFSRDDAGIYNATYTLRFRAGSSGQTLTVKWAAQTISANDGNVALQAIALR